MHGVSRLILNGRNIKLRLRYGARLEHHVHIIQEQVQLPREISHLIYDHQFSEQLYLSPRRYHEGKCGVEYNDLMNDGNSPQPECPSIAGSIYHRGIAPLTSLLVLDMTIQLWLSSHALDQPGA